MQLSDFLKKMAGKLNLQDNPTFVELVNKPALASVEVNDELATNFDTGLMSLAGAINNQDVLKAHKPILLNSLDEQFAQMAAKYGFVEENKAEKSTYNRAKILEQKLDATIAELKAKSGNGGDEKLQKEITRLQAELASAASAKAKEIQELQDGFAKQILSSLIDAELKGKSYANTELGDTNHDIARALLTKALEADGAIMVNDNGRVVLRNKENPTLEYYDQSHRQVGFSDYVDKLLSDKHMLAVSNPNPNTGKKTIVDPGKEGPDLSKFQAAVASSSADLGDN